MGEGSGGCESGVSGWKEEDCSSSEACESSCMHMVVHVVDSDKWTHFNDFPH